MSTAEAVALAIAILAFAGVVVKALFTKLETIHVLVNSSMSDARKDIAHLQLLIVVAGTLASLFAVLRWFLDRRERDDRERLG